MEVRVIVDSRIRIEAAGALGAGVVADLKREFEHDNPEWAKKRHLGLPTWNVPKTMVTWRAEGGVLSFPRGGMSRVTRILRECGVDADVYDARQYGVEVEMPEFRRVLYPFQADIVEKAIEREQCLIRAPTGCISGTAVVELNRAGKSFRCSLADLVEMHAGGTRGWRMWDPEIPTRIRMRTAEGFVRLGTVVDAYSSGVRKTYRVTTSSGKSVRATLDHRFLSEKDGWTTLGQLRVGDRVYVDGGERGEGAAVRKAKATYRLVNGLPRHPYAGRRGVRPDKGGWSVPFHRLVAEAGLNRMDVGHFVRCIKADLAKGLVFLNPATHHVHHEDEDPTNNDPRNLVIMSPSEHQTEHGKAGGWRRVTARTSLDEIVGIGEAEAEETYDVEVLEDDHNFLASGFVVHNSGKTSALLAIASAVRVPTLVVVHSQALLDQWRERAVSELGLRPSQVGIVQGKKFDLRPMTLTIQKSMAKVAAESQEVRDYFGCVIADEVHMFAAATFFQCIDPFPARYRIGASADHRRKDRREFLIHDLFGDVAADVSREELVESGHVLDVEIRVLPTEFAAPWYGVPVDREDARQLNFVRLVQEMAEDSARNWSAIRTIREEVAAGEQVLVMCHEREHCMKVGQMLVGYGIPSGYLLGGPESAKEFATSIAGLKSGALRVGVGTYKAIGTGIDIPRVGVAVAMTPIGGNQQNFGQVRGRVCRTAEGKTIARLYLLWDRCVYPSHLKNFVAWNTDVSVREESGNWLPAKTYIRDDR